MELLTTSRSSWKSLLVPLVIVILFGAYLSYVSTYYPSNASASTCAANPNPTNAIGQNNPGPSRTTVFQIPQPGQATFCILYHVSPTSDKGTERLLPNFGPAGPPLMTNGYAACGFNISISINNDCRGLSATVTPPSVNYYGNQTFSAEITINATADSTAGTYMLFLPGPCGEGLVIYFILGTTLPSSVIHIPFSLCFHVSQVFNATASIVLYQGAYALQLPVS